MDQPAPRKAPYFDLDLLRHEASELARAHAGQASTLRVALVERLRGLVHEARATAKRQLEEDGEGRKCAEDLSTFQDALIALAYDFTVKHVYPTENPSAAERMAIVAQGGYGRGLLAPGSDIDLLFLLPYKQTAWGESVAEYMLYVLWDLGFKVGHATRNIDQCIRRSLSDMTIRTALLDARLILGDEALFAEFRRRFRNEVLEGNARAFIEAKLSEQNTRHARAGASRYLVEPNIKDGKGGLRDLHTLHWLAKHLYPDKAEAEFVEAGVTLLVKPMIGEDGILSVAVTPARSDPPAPPMKRTVQSAGSQFSAISATVGARSGGIGCSTASSAGRPTASSPRHPPTIGSWWSRSTARPSTCSNPSSSSPCSTRPTSRSRSLIPSTASSRRWASSPPSATPRSPSPAALSPTRRRYSSSTTSAEAKPTKFAALQTVRTGF